MFSLESPHRGDSNEYKQHAIINIKKKITLNYPKYNNVCSYGIFSQGLKNEFEIAVVNEPSVFEPLKLYGILERFIVGKETGEHQQTLIRLLMEVRSRSTRLVLKLS